MSYLTHFLKFPDKATADGLLFETVDGEMFPIYSNTDVVGVIYDDRETPPVVKEGWHVNLRVRPDEDTSPLDAYKITPVNPKRVFA